MRAEIINQPSSGEFKERIYDLESPWNSQSWTWIKFTDDLSNESVGQFRGIQKAVKVSDIANEIIVLTSDCVFRLDSIELNVIEIESQPEYQDIEVSPKGVFILHTYYEILKMGKSLSEMTEISSPFQMDDIRFKNWNNEILEFSCEEFTNWSRNEIMELNSIDWKIKIKKNAPQHNV